jgi:hypothetical protein
MQRIIATLAGLLIGLGLLAGCGSGSAKPAPPTPNTALPPTLTLQVDVNGHVALESHGTTIHATAAKTADNRCVGLFSLYVINYAATPSTVGLTAIDQTVGGPAVNTVEAGTTAGTDSQEPHLVAAGTYHIQINGAVQSDLPPITVKIDGPCPK